jgi:ABC-2 type transport system permease protein
MKKKINFIVVVILSIFIWIMINYISMRQYERFDLTQKKFFSISPKTKKILDKLENTLKITVIIPENIELYNYIKKLLETYKLYNSKIIINYFDQIKDRIKAEKLAAKFKISSPDIIIFEYNNKYKFVRYENLFELEKGFRNQSHIKFFKGEEQFSYTILSLLENYKKTIYLMKAENRGFKVKYFKNELLEKNNYLVKEIDLDYKNKIPDECDLLILIYFKRNFSEQMEYTLLDYLSKGGKVLFFLNPDFRKNASSENLNIFFENYGIFLKNNVIIDYNTVEKSSGKIICSNFPFSELAQDFPVVLTLTSSINITQNQKVNNKILMTSTEYSSEKNALDKLSEEFNFQDSSKKIKFNLGVLSENFINKSKLGLIGNAGLISDDYIINYGNKIFIINLINYLCDKKYLIGISGKSPERVSLTMSSKQVSDIFFYSVLIVPIIAILLGYFVCSRRMKK